MSSSTESQDIIGQLDECYGNILALARSMTEPEWATQSLCPDWNSRGVILHLVAVENMLLGWRPMSAEEALPFGSIVEFISQAEPWGRDELAEHCSRIFAARASELVNLSDDQWAQPCPTPVGPATYQDFMNIRVFDFWVHERDMATPLGRVTNDATPAAVTSLDQVHTSMGYIVGKRIGLPDGMSILFDVEGDMGRKMAVAVDGRAKVVEHVENPDVTVATDVVTFMQLACGRIDPLTQIDSGRITWTGDDKWGRKAASNLRFTM